MERSENIDKLAAALAKFQGELEQPAMNSSVKVDTKSGRSYSFKYADLSACKAAAKKPLCDNELSVTQLIEEDYSVVTVLMHSSGQFISSKVRMPIVNGRQEGAQSVGSSITYAKRYAYCAILGIVADEDDDGNMASGNYCENKNNQSQPQQKRQPQQPQKPVFSDKQLNNKDFFPRIDAARKKSEAEGKSFSLKLFLEQYFQPLDEAALEIINAEYAQYRINQSN